jgi:hypothetical protein
MSFYQLGESIGRHIRLEKLATLEGPWCHIKGRLGVIDL